MFRKDSRRHAKKIQGFSFCSGFGFFKFFHLFRSQLSRWISSQFSWNLCKMEKPVFLLYPFSNLLETSRIKLYSGSLIFSMFPRCFSKILERTKKTPGYFFHSKVTTLEDAGSKVQLVQSSTVAIFDVYFHEWEGFRNDARIFWKGICGDFQCRW